MRWMRYRRNGRERFGLLEGDSLFATESSWDDVLAGVVRQRYSAPLEPEFEILPPVPAPGKIVAVGLNYRDHCREQKVDPPAHPILFSKFPSTIIGQGGVIEWSGQLSSRVDLEVELAVVIGRRARNLAEANALEAVLGYTVANDVSARDLQFGDGQWIRGKNLDGFCPLGPCLVTADEIADPQALRIRSDLNGTILQDSSTAEMIFPISQLIAFCSESFTLYPGDVLLTGTPDGVGVFRKPPVFMRDGDRVGVEVEGIGRLENLCRVR